MFVHATAMTISASHSITSKDKFYTESVLDLRNGETVHNLHMKMGSTALTTTSSKVDDLLRPCLPNFRTTQSGHL